VPGQACRILTSNLIPFVSLFRETGSELQLKTQVLLLQGIPPALEVCGDQPISSSPLWNAIVNLRSREREYKFLCTILKNKCLTANPP
jgi:hypothetical protein